MDVFLRSFNGLNGEDACFAVNSTSFFRLNRSRRRSLALINVNECLWNESPINHAPYKFRERSETVIQRRSGSKRQCLDLYEDGEDRTRISQTQGHWKTENTKQFDVSTESPAILRPIADACPGEQGGGRWRYTMAEKDERWQRLRRCVCLRLWIYLQRLLVVYYFELLRHCHSSCYVWGPAAFRFKRPIDRALYNDNPSWRNMNYRLMPNSNARQANNCLRHNTTFLSLPIDRPAIQLSDIGLHVGLLISLCPFQGQQRTDIIVYT